MKKKPVCPNCDSDVFQELQSVSMLQQVVWNPKISRYEYGESKLADGDVEYHCTYCDNCGTEIDGRLLEGWID